MSRTKELKLKLYHDLEAVYHRFFDELAQSNLPDGEAARITQAALLSRQEGLKHLVSEQDLDVSSS